MRAHRLYACLLYLIVVSGSAAELAHASQPVKATVSFFRATLLPKWAAPLAAIPPTSRRDPVVIRLSETQAWTGTNPAVLVNRAIQVNDKSHLGEIGQYGLPYYPAYQKLQLHRVAILRGEQTMERTATVHTRLLERESNLESGFYVGETTVQLLLDDIRVGDTLWITYTVEGRNPVFGSIWADDFSWNTGRPVEQRVLTISHPANRSLQWRELGDLASRGITPTVERSGAVERLRFEGRGLDPLEAEANMPADYLPVTMLQTSEYASWQEVAQWAAGLFAVRSATPAVSSLARQFETAGSNEEARASAALHWVQDEVRYFSVALGENSHRPQAPDVVLTRRYGDCKDKSNLLVALLARLGITAEPVLVSARTPTLPLKLLPSPSWFDHVIVRVHADGKTYYVDPTREGEKGAMSRLDVALPGAAGLVVASSTKDLITLPEPANDFPWFESGEKFLVNDLAGDVRLEVENRFRGKYARFARLRHAAMTASEIQKDILEDYEKQFPGVTLSGNPQTEDSADGSMFTVRATLNLPKPITHAEGWYSIDHKTRIMDGTLGIPDKLTRSYPFELPYGLYHARYHLQIVWPERVKLVNLNSAKSIDNAFFRAQKELSWYGNELDFVIDYAIKRKRLNPGEMTELNAQGKLLPPFIESTLKFHESSTVQEEAKQVGVRDGHVAHGTLAMRETAALLKGGTKTRAASVTPELLCESMFEIAFLKDVYPVGLVAPARQIYQAFDGLKNQDTEKALCLGRLELATGKPEISIEQFRKAGLPRKSEEHTLELAWARLVSGDRAGAAADAARFLTHALAEHALEAGDAAFAMLVLQGGGEAPSTEFERYIQLLPDGPWPRPVLAYLSGQLSAEQLIGVATQFGPIKQEYALNEAWFFIAEHLKQQGKLEAAHDALRWFPARGIHNTRSAMLASRELVNIEMSDPDFKRGLAATDLTPPDFKSAKNDYLAAAARGLAAAEFELGFLAEHGKGERADPVAAFGWYHRAAKHGHLGAMNALGLLYEEGRGVEKSDALAIQWFTRAAEPGQYYASRNLGVHYLYGTGGLARDAKLAIKHLYTAAQLGNAEAQGMLAELYFEGLDGTGTRDVVRSLYWASRATELGDVRGRAQFAFMLAYGHGIEQDLPKAIEIWRKAAADGSNAAQVQLGNAYQRGHGVNKDLAQALSWFEQSAAGANRYAMQQVGNAYLYGLGTRADPKKARGIFNDLVAKGDSTGYCMLASMAKAGKGGPVDPSLAAELFRKGTADGNMDCEIGLASTLHFGGGGTADLKEAAILYRKAANRGNLYALNNLADLYEKGMGVEQDLPQAVKLYRQAAQEGYATSLFSLGELYELDKGLPMDAYLAYVYYQLAQDAGLPNAAKNLERIKPALSADQLEQAHHVSSAWKPKQALPGIALVNASK
ncbi:MAG: DUF3857 domain-containing protein [Pseudomonadota bacterium]